MQKFISFKRLTPILLTITAVFAIAAGAVDGYAAQSKPVSDTPLATVNNVPITREDLNTEVRQLKTELALKDQRLSNHQLSRLRHQMLENLIERELLYQQAEEKDIQLSYRWVIRGMDELKEQLGRKISMDTFLERCGITQSQLKERIRKGLIIQRLLRRDVIRSTRVSEAEMQAFYSRHPELFRRSEQIRARHIFIDFKNSADSARKSNPRQRIEAIQAKLDQGADFAVLAFEYSDCPSKIRGGDLGYFTRDQVIAPFAEAAFKLESGAISGIVETPLGYHLIQVLDHKPPSQMVYKNARVKIERTLRRNKENAAVNAYLARLKRGASIRRGK